MVRGGGGSTPPSPLTEKGFNTYTWQTTPAKAIPASPPWYIHHFYNFYTWFTLLGCLFVFQFPINVRTAEPNGPTFCVLPYMTPEEGLWMLRIKKVVFKSFLFLKYLKIRELFFIIVLYWTKRTCSQIELQLKVEVEDGRSLNYTWFSLLQFFLFIKTFDNYNV